MILFPPAFRSHQFGQAALAVVLFYGVFAALWILLSDQAVEALFSDPKQIIQASMIKGWLFVAATTLLLYLLVARLLARQRADSQCIIDNLQAKQRAQDLLSTVIDNTEDAIYAQDEDGRYVLFNRAACQFMGKSVTQVLGNTDDTLFPPEQADMLNMINQRIMSSGNPESMEGLFDTAAGKRYFIIAKRPLRDQNGKTIGTFGIARDITDRKQAEDILVESEERFRTLASNIPGAVYRCDLALPWRCSMMSEGVLPVTGHAPQAFLRSEAPLNWADLIVTEDLPRVEQEIANGIRQNRSYSIVYRIRHADGNIRWVLENGRAIYDAVEIPQHLDGVIFDITDHKRAEEELKSRNEELERFNRATIGRELDMIELKKRINELSRELGREPPYALNFLNPGPDENAASHEP